MKTLTVVHLEDNPADRKKVSKLKGKIAGTFNAFYQDHFRNRNRQKPTEFAIDIVQASNIEDFRRVLFADEGMPKNGKSNEVISTSLTGNGEKCILFLLDYYVPETKDGKAGPLSELKVDNMLFPDWLQVQFPAIPNLILSMGKGVDIVPGYDFLSKDALENEEDFCNQLFHRFQKWWAPDFWNALYDYGKTHGKTSWHTPGHNQGNAFLRSEFQRDFYENYGSLTFRTDLSVSVGQLGDLSEPDQKSPLKSSQVRSAEIFGSKDTFYVTNGTSTSNKAMLMTLLRPGEVVLLDRNCHKSVHQAVVMSGAHPVYMPPAYNKKLGVWAPVSWSTLEKYVGYDYPHEIKPRMLILTSCTYEGILYPISKIVDLCEENGILFYADEAWAPYLRFHPYYVHKRENGELSRYSAMDAGAHFSVQSTHKALAAFSQASMIHVSERFAKRLEGTSTAWEWLHGRFSFNGRGSYEKFRHDFLEVLRYWHSTSPHYPMLATLDRAGIQMRLEGMRMISERLRWVEEFKDDVNKVTDGCIIEMEDIVGKGNIGDFKNYRKDPLKLVIGFKDLIAGNNFKDILAKEHIQCEKQSSGCIEFLVTIGTFNDHLQSLSHIISTHPDLVGRPEPDQYGVEQSNISILENELEVLPRIAAQSDGELVKLEESAGRICAQMLVPYPPGIPVFLPGMKITEEMKELVLHVRGDGSKHNVHGIFESRENGPHVKVMKEEDRRNPSYARSKEQMEKMNAILREISNAI